MEVESPSKDQLLLILPQFIKPIWSTSESILQDLSRNKLPSLFDFLETIGKLISLHYLPSKKRTHNMVVLLRFLEEFTQKDSDYFLQTFLPKLATLALRVKDLFPESLLLLKQNHSKTLLLSKPQISCLIANMFFCTFHHQTSEKLPKTCSFVYLYSEELPSRTPLKVNKIKCFYNYLKRAVSGIDSQEFVLYQRLLLSEDILRNSLGFWLRSHNPLQTIDFEAKPGKIEGAEAGKYLKTVFSNKKLGGGVMNNGGLQEELMFCQNCEMLVASLVFEELEDYEAGVILGAEQYNLTENYGEKFKFLSDFKDKTPVDVFGKKDTAYILIDAMNFTDPREQYKMSFITRELNKAYLGFQAVDSMENNEERAVATGKWGCGDFQGDFELKIIIQWLAASENKRRVKFYLNGEEDEKKYQMFYERMKGKTVGEVVGILKEFSRTFIEENVDIGVFDFIRDFCE